MELRKIHLFLNTVSLNFHVIKINSVHPDEQKHNEQYIDQRVGQ